MLKNLFPLLALAAIPSFAETTGFTIDNVHTIDKSGLVIRGAAPGLKTTELTKAKVTNVLILKPENKKGEVASEVEQLKAAKIQSKVIPMEWKGPELEKICHQVVDAVDTLQKLKQQKKKVYFHCSLGQDRTGLVAGLFRMVDQGWTQEEAFKDEMCVNGYSDGNPTKPGMVYGAIAKTLTPIFLALSNNLKKSSKTLNLADCNHIEIPETIPSCKKPVF